VGSKLGVIVGSTLGVIVGSDDGIKLGIGVAHTGNKELQSNPPNILFITLAPNIEQRS